MSDTTLNGFRRGVTAALLLAISLPLPAFAQVKAQARSAPTPPWEKGILPISPESYYHAIECGKQGGQDPPCVFWDTGLCKNDDFALAMYTPYKMVAYQVWATIRQKKEAPTPNYQQAQQTRVTVGVTPVKGSKNALKELVLKRAGKVVPPVSRTVATGDARYTFDYPAFAPTAAVTLDMVGQVKTISCVIDTPVLIQFR